LGTPKLSELLDTEITSPTNEQMLIYNAAKEKWVNADPNVTIVGDEVLRGTDNRTLTDLYNQLQYLGTHKLQFKSWDSGFITVSAASSTSYLSVSGIGEFIKPNDHYSLGIAPDKARHQIKLDDDDPWRPLTYTIPSVGFCQGNGYTSAGVYSEGLTWFRVVMWDTTNNEYRVWCYTGQSYPFRNSLEAILANDDSANDATMKGILTYSLFVASRQALLAIPKFINAKIIRELLDKRVSAVEVMTAGFFEKEEEIPHIEFLKEEKDYHLTEIAKKKPLTYVVVTYPDNVELKHMLNKFKPVRILHDNILD